jgi:hypothetical protein
LFFFFFKPINNNLFICLRRLFRESEESVTRENVSEKEYVYEIN